MVVLFLVFEEPTYCFPKGLCKFTFSPTAYEDSCFPTPSPTFVVFCVLFIYLFIYSYVHTWFGPFFPLPPPPPSPPTPTLFPGRTYSALFSNFVEEKT
jgi:hypothetical protein